MKVLGPLSLITVAASLAACQPRPPAFGDRMFDHFQRAGQVQTALIAGDLNAAARAAEWIEYDVFEEIPPESWAWVERVQNAAADVHGATSIDEAADATGRMAAACAGCHRETDGGPVFRQATPTPPTGTRVNHMIRHLWAVDRMWEGLIGPSSAAWSAGASAIADVAPERNLPGGAETAALAERVHSIAAGARTADESERAEAYAALLGTCAACHTALDVGDM